MQVPKLGEQQFFKDIVKGAKAGATAADLEAGIQLAPENMPSMTHMNVCVRLSWRPQLDLASTLITYRARAVATMRSEYGCRGGSVEGVRMLDMNLSRREIGLIVQESGFGGEIDEQVARALQNEDQRNVPCMGM